MPVRVVEVAYGWPAAQALRDAVADGKGGDPLAPITVVVPTNHVGVAARRMLASGELGPVVARGTGLAAVTFLTVHRLAELLGASRLAEAGRRPLSTPVLAAALRTQLSEAPGAFAPVAGHPATESALVRASRELRDLTAGARAALAATSPRAADVVRLHDEARRRLAARWYDEVDLLEAATDALAAAGNLPADIGSLVVHLPQRLSRSAGRFLTAAGKVTDVTVVAGLTGDDRADAEVVTSVRRLRPRHRPGAVRPQLAPAGPTRIVSTSDADDEVRVAVRAVVDATHDGVPLSRMAVLHPGADPYARLLHEHLAAAGIAVNGVAVSPLAGRVAGRALLDLLRLPDVEFRRDAVFAWLASLPVREVDGAIPVAAWERASRAAAVVAGRDHWDRLLAEHAEVLERQAGAASGDPDLGEWLPDRLRREAQTARDLRAYVVELIDGMAGCAAEARPWGELAAWATNLLHRIVGDAVARRCWPIDERKAAERVELALHRLAGLDGVEGPVPLDVFLRTLALELEADLGRAGRFGSCVLVASVGMAVGLDLDLAVVVGLAEGSFPTPVGHDSLLPDDERAMTAGELPLLADGVDRQHRHLLAVLAGARRHVLCLPRGDLRRSTTRVPSRWIAERARAMAGVGAERSLETLGPVVDVVASFDAGLRSVRPATPQEHRLRDLLARDGPRLSPVAVAAVDAAVARGFEAIAARRSASFTRFDGNLAGLRIPSPVDTVTSPTGLERWARCPFDYFLRSILRVEPVENPEDVLQITPRALGTLVHEVLEQFFGEVLARPGGPPRPGTPWSAADRGRLAAIAGTLCDEREKLGLTGQPLFWRRDRARILRELDRLLDLDEQHRAQHGTTPLAVELAFGMAGAATAGLPPVEVTLGDGRAIRFRGRADRLDRCEDGTLHVVDYKTGRSSAYTSLGPGDPAAGGTRLQLPVYALAARLHSGQPDAAVVSEYWFATGRGEFRRIGYEVSGDVITHFAGTVTAVVRGVEAGVFPFHPTAASTAWVDCVACDPDGLGVVDLRRAWERKRSDPALAHYAGLVEPVTLDPEREAERA